MVTRYDLTDEVIVVTGGGSGIGAGFCHRCAALGGVVIAADINEENAKAVAESAPGPGKVDARQVDVSDPRAVERLFSGVLDLHGKIDALVHSAAIQPRTPIAEMSDDEWARVMDVNLTSAFYCSRAVVPSMISRKRGSIVTFTSGLAKSGWPKASAYSATKAGIIAFTKSLAQELVPYNVRANVIAPGVTASPLFTEPNTPEEQEYFRKQKGIGSVEDVVPLLLFLISDSSASLTGSVLDRELIIPSSP